MASQVMSAVACVILLLQCASVLSSGVAATNGASRRLFQSPSPGMPFPTLPAQAGLPATTIPPKVLSDSTADNPP